MPYPVYILATLGAPRNHHAIFIETRNTHTNTLTGAIFQVTGNIQTGMTFNHKDINTNPEDDIDFISKEFIETIDEQDLDRVKEIVNAVEPPRKQFHGPKRIDPSAPLRRRQEWT
ncbi:hypothetical protein M011DRAFT_381536, partial [Sporormia fimetaria CBS 119925]